MYPCFQPHISLLFTITKAQQKQTGFVQPLLRVVSPWSFHSSLLHFTFCLLEIYQNLSVVDDFHNLLALIGINFGISVLWLNTVSKGTESKYVFLVCHLELKIPVDFSIQHSLRKKKPKLSIHRWFQLFLRAH